MFILSRVFVQPPPEAHDNGREHTDPGPRRGVAGGRGLASPVPIELAKEGIPLPFDSRYGPNFETARHVVWFVVCKAIPVFRPSVIRCSVSCERPCSGRDGMGWDNGVTFRAVHRSRVLGILLPELFEYQLVPHEAKLEDGTVVALNAQRKKYWFSICHSHSEICTMNLGGLGLGARGDLLLHSYAILESTLFVTTRLLRPRRGVVRRSVLLSGTCTTSEATERRFGSAGIPRRVTLSLDDLDSLQPTMR
ncbi:hypothetical protein HD554DRAFT_2037240 [Boletus coccyginus]|nr:hypothetical protein HD554DRAFT_2037240 [Boletus coccyginus]